MRLKIALPAVRRLKLDYRRVVRGTTSTFAKATDIEALKQRFGPLRPIPARGGNLILAADVEKARAEGIKVRGKKRTFVPLVLLIRSVRVPKKLSFNAIAQAWANRLGRITERLLNRAE